MITVHHLNASRSTRIVWLLEELGLDYEIVHHQRDAATQRSPESLRTIHRLAKSPTVEVDGLVLGAWRAAWQGRRCQKKMDSRKGLTQGSVA